jgi:hypothetical protein
MSITSTGVDWCRLVSIGIDDGLAAAGFSGDGGGDMDFMDRL